MFIDETSRHHKSRQLAEAIKDMEKVLNFAKSFGIFVKVFFVNEFCDLKLTHPQVHFDISLVHNYAYYEDFVFQAVLKQHEKVLAATAQNLTLIVNHSLVWRCCCWRKLFSAC